MKLSEFVKLLNSQCLDDDPEILFESYEWDDDLENLSYHTRDFDGVSRREDQIIIKTSRWW